MVSSSPPPRDNPSNAFSIWVRPEEAYHLTWEGLPALARLAPQLPKLQLLVFSRPADAIAPINPLGTQSRAAWSDASSLVDAAQHWSQLQFLDLTGNLCSRAAAWQLPAAAEHLRQLRHLDLSGNILNQEVQAVAAAVECWPHLQVLNLADNSLGPDELDVLADAAQHMSGLRSLDLSNNFLGHALTCTADSLIAAAKQWPLLPGHLNLSLNYLRDGAVQAVADAAPHMPQLQRLDVSRNRIGNDGFVCLAAAAPHLSQLQCLDLEYSYLSGCVATRALKEVAVPHWTQLQDLRLSNNYIPPAAVQDLLVAVPGWQQALQSFFEGSSSGNGCQSEVEAHLSEAVAQLLNM